MTRPLKIQVDWERLDSGEPEERSCFAAIGIQANNIWLTEVRDALANRLRQAPLLSAYHLAEWFAWNWWRLRWEPRADTMEWRLAHKMSNIGGGYVWPNITLFSDGERTALIAQPSKEMAEAPFRYIADTAVFMPSSSYESEIDTFIDQVLERLQAENIRDSNLAALWGEILGERADPHLSQIRKLEALMGRDPEEADENLVSRLLADARVLGASGIEELAADYPHLADRGLPSADELARYAREAGFEVSPDDMASLPHSTGQHGLLPAWRIGADAAQALREQERLGEGDISDQRLTGMLAVDPAALNYTVSPPDVSFFLETAHAGGRIVLRRKTHSGRRFELARLLGDHLIANETRFLPATGASTYRQKAQRAFAAELLSPFNSVMERLQGDYSPENLSDVAEQFQVSELTIRTQLVNHRILEREDLDLELAAA